MAIEWLHDPDEFAPFVYQALAESVNYSDDSGRGDGVHIGIVDSVGALPSGWDGSDSKYVRPHATIDDDLTTGHGLYVSNQLSKFASDSARSYYQAVNKNGDLPTKAFEDAIDRAIEDGVDILNISAGGPALGMPADIHPTARPVKDALDEHITVVAGAGNFTSEYEIQPPVHAPAAVEGVIAVGGFVTTCPNSCKESSQAPDSGPYRAPQETGSERGEPTGTYCGQKECTSGRCIRQKSDQEWEANPRETTNSPSVPEGDRECDVLAPAHHPGELEDGTELRSGTSYAAPVVSGILAAIYSDIELEYGRFPRPEEAKQAITNTLVAMDEGPHKKLNGFGLEQELKSIVAAEEQTTADQ